MLNMVVHPATDRVNDHSMKHCRTCWFWLSSRYNFLKHERAGLKLTRACNIETVTHSCTAECSSLWSLLLQVAYFKKSCKGNKSRSLAWLIFPYSCLRGDLEEGCYAENLLADIVLPKGQWKLISMTCVCICRWNLHPWHGHMTIKASSTTSIQNPSMFSHSHNWNIAAMSLVKFWSRVHATYVFMF